MTEQEKNIKIEELLTRGVENVYPSVDFLRDKLNSGEKLTLYLGIDPTGPSLHLGHAIPMNKLRQFQELGHEIIFLIGSFTAMIGDPTDKSATRTQLTREQVLENAKEYQNQAATVLDFTGDNPVLVKYNGDWHDGMTFKDVIELSSHFTVQQMLERDMFANRMAEGKPIRVHEFMYPLMQGYDCVAMDVDGELGGNDQTFNMLAGRTLMKAMKDKEKFVVSVKLLTDVNGKKMGKSEGNMLRLDDSPEDMFGKVMSWSDDMIGNGFELCTRVPMDEVSQIKHDLYETQTGNPRDLKMRLGREVVALYYDEAAAQKAQDHFITVFSNKAIPDDMPEVKTDVAGISIVEALVSTGLCSSKSDARRQITQGGVKVDGEVINDEKAHIDISVEGTVLQKGKRHFVKLIRG